MCGGSECEGHRALGLRVCGGTRCRGVQVCGVLGVLWYVVGCAGHGAAGRRPQATGHTRAPAPSLAEMSRQLLGKEALSLDLPFPLNLKPLFELGNHRTSLLCCTLLSHQRLHGF